MIWSGSVLVHQREIRSFLANRLPMKFNVWTSDSIQRLEEYNLGVKAFNLERLIAKSRGDGFEGSDVSDPNECWASSV